MLVGGTWARRAATSGVGHQQDSCLGNGQWSLGETQERTKRSSDGSCGDQGKLLTRIIQFLKLDVPFVVEKFITLTVMLKWSLIVKCKDVLQLCL